MTGYEEFEYEMINGIVAFIVSLAFIFIGVCLLIFCLSRSGTKKFLKQTTQENYRKANGFYIASIVFTVFIVMFTISGIPGFFDTVFNLLEDPDPDMLVWNIVEIVEFALAVTAMVLGICALAAFGKAKTVYRQVYPPQTTYYTANGQGWQYNRQTYQQYPQQGYQQPTQQGYPQQNPHQAYQQQYTGYPQPYNPQQGYPQPTNSQQGYPQPVNSQQSYPQPVNSQQGYPQPVNSQQGYPQPTNTQPTAAQQTTYSTATATIPAAPAEKMCPHCGVVNDGKNQTCMFCGKPM